MNEPRRMDLREFKTLRQDFQFSGNGLFGENNHAALQFGAELVGYGGGGRGSKIHRVDVHYGSAGTLDGNQSQLLPDVRGQQTLTAHTSEQQADGFERLAGRDEDQDFEPLFFGRHERSASPQERVSNALSFSVKEQDQGRSPRPVAQATWATLRRGWDLLKKTQTEKPLRIPLCCTQSPIKIEPAVAHSRLRHRLRNGNGRRGRMLIGSRQKAKHEIGAAGDKGGAERSSPDRGIG